MTKEEWYKQANLYDCPLSGKTDWLFITGSKDQVVPIDGVIAVPDDPSTGKVS